jgi:purine nucleosidase
MSRTFLIDTDGGSDDAIAILMAVNDPSVHVTAITTVSGNVSVTQATQNILYVLELPAFLSQRRVDP